MNEIQPQQPQQLQQLQQSYLKSLPKRKQLRTLKDEPAKPFDRV
jgi:hypothetical protein